MDEVVFKVRNPYINEGIWDYNVYLKNEVEKHINEVMELDMFKANGGMNDWHFSIKEIVDEVSKGKRDSFQKQIDYREFVKNKKRKINRRKKK